MEKVKIILDTDIGADCDDMLALGEILEAEREGAAELLCVTHCLKTPCGAAAVRSVLRFFGRGDIPVGVMNGGADIKDVYAEALANRFASERDISEAPSAVSVLRRALAECDGKAVICAIGQLTNIAALILSEPDGVSELSGEELIRNKCSRLVIMGGGFAPDADGKNIPEWNIKWDISAADTVLSRTPVQTVLLPFETGARVLSGKRLMERFSDENPITHAFYTFLGKAAQRPSWDPLTALYALGAAGDILSESERGEVRVDSVGATYFEVREGGLHSVLRLKSLPGEDIREAEAAAGDVIDSYVERLLDSTC